MARFGPVPPQVRALSGTLWVGQARLAGGLTLSWAGNWRSIPARFRIETAVGLRGPGTLLEGTGFAGIGQFGLMNLKGRAGPEVLALLPGSVPCDGLAVVDIDRIAWSRAAVTSVGRVRIGESRCTLPGRDALATPALNLDLAQDGTDAMATLTTDDAARTLMGTARLGPDGWARVRIEPAGARLLPGLPASAPTELEFQLD